MTPSTVAGLALFGLVTVAALLLLVAFGLMRLARRGSPATRNRDGGAESAMLSMALQEAVGKLRAQERAAEARAEASERFASRIVQGLTSGLMVVDQAGVVQTVNAAARRLLQMDESAVGAPYRHALATAPELADVIGEVLATASPVVRRKLRLVSRAGPSHLGITVSPIPDAKGALQAAVCLFTDLTAVVELEEQLRLKEALARLGELTAGLAHEFRNGLATIHGYGRLLDPATLPASQAACVEGIRAETTALGEVVTNFLRFARPDALTLSPVDLRAVISRAADDAAGDQRVTIEGAFGTIDGDEVLLRQAFSNLLRNSLEACSAAGVAARVAVEGAVQDDEVVVTVGDNGPGLTDETLARLFQPFMTTKPNGTGLGLAVVQKIIVSHNGRVVAGNRPGGGAEFRIRLPIPSTR